MDNSIRRTRREILLTDILVDGITHIARGLLTSIIILFFAGIFLLWYNIITAIILVGFLYHCIINIAYKQGYKETLAKLQQVAQEPEDSKYLTDAEWLEFDAYQEQTKRGTPPSNRNAR